MAPMARVVCYYIRATNREIVADAINLSIEGLFKTDVRIATSDRELEPSKDIDIDVKTKPRSFVGILGIDQSVLLLRSGNDITKMDVTKEVKSYESNSRNHNVIDQANNVDSFSAKSIFDDSNLMVITNGLLYDGPATREGKLVSWQGSLGKSDKSGVRNGIIALDQLILEDRLAAPEFHIERQPSDRITIRDFFPETWLWANSTSGNDGLAHFKSKTPDSITSWVISAFSINDNDGLGIAANNAKVTVFKQFFVKLNLPYSIIRGETVRIQAIIHNYSKKPTRAVVTMDNKRGDFEFVEAANELEEEKHLQDQQQSQRIEIGAQEGKAISFLVTPKKLGYLEIVVSALSERFSDAVRQNILVKPEGQTQHFNKAIFIAAGDPSSTTNFKKNISIDIPANAVPGSTKVFLAAVGDMMSFSLNHLETGEILRLPIDGGEQNMFNLVPNIVMYNYLKQTNQLSDNKRDKLLRLIQNGYQQELTYKRQDGSFGAFGNKDDHGSTWLTAYVLKTFHQIRDLITVDNDVMQRALAYLASRQQNDGSFEELGQLHNKELADNNQAIYLTAYVLIALINNRNIVQKPEISLVAVDDVIDKGLSFLDRHTDESGNPYDLAIVSYVYHQLGANRRKSPTRDSSYSRLTQLAHTNEEFTWWQSDSKSNLVDSSLSPPRINEEEDSLEREFEFNTPKKQHSNSSLDHPPPLKPLAVTTRHSEHLFVPDSLAIEMTSYALMTILLRNDIDYATPVVRWLIAQQNSNGGFATTHDTVLALEALSLYQAKLPAASPPTTLDIDFTYANFDKDGKRSQLRPIVFDQILVKKSNSLVYQTKQLPDNATWVDIQASGQGSAVLQVSWQYNLLVSAEAPSFFLNPQLDKSSTEHYLQLSICSYYKAGETSNMVVMEVDLPSGYVAEVEALPSITRSKHIKQIYLSQQDTHLSVFFDKMTREEICFTIPAHRSTFVANNKQVAVIIYDYYNRHRAARIFYEPHILTSCEICDKRDCKSQCSKVRRNSRLILNSNNNNNNNNGTTDGKSQTTTNGMGLSSPSIVTSWASGVFLVINCAFSHALLYIVNRIL